MSLPPAPHLSLDAFQKLAEPGQGLVDVTIEW